MTLTATLVTVKATPVETNVNETYGLHGTLSISAVNESVWVSVSAVPIVALAVVHGEQSPYLRIALHHAL